MSEKKPTPSFEADGHVWPICISIGMAERFKRELGLDLGEDLGNFFAGIAANRMHLAAVLWICCEKLCDERGIKPADFAELLTAPVLEEASNALVEAVILFIPPQQRDPLRRLIAATEQAELVGMEKTIEMLQDRSFLDRLGEATEKRIRSAVAQTVSGSTSGTSRDD